ncbi:hypothetical protein BO78DRAFT_217503 [Aspergillus sclerotiicarbonarius CBS 121057]|uniref:Uncharacterized protein n=1 Tax=Aspergillus sclerotiicarbonarius (strain CBS 121057 / IBT 28362) TaxID=1448318 RepID=A0A319EP42_ASPSB|nr:hypothetical protein BO78DRAFT_217503 [Aspergillus sclerotiicarbonarius CBS 121057]
MCQCPSQVTYSSGRAGRCLPSILHFLILHPLTLFAATSNSLSISRLRGVLPNPCHVLPNPPLLLTPVTLISFLKSCPPETSLCAVPHQYACNSLTDPSPPTTHPTYPLSLPCFRAPSTIVVVVEPLDPSFYTFV